MLSPENALDRLTHALAAARRLGADAADALYAAEASTGIGVRLGELEDIGRSEGEEVGVRVFAGSRAAIVTTSDLSPRGLETAVERALAMAREAPDDPYAGLAPQELLARGPFPDLDLHDPAAAGLSSEALRDMALEAEDAARAAPGITNSEGGNAAAGEGVTAFLTSHGFAAGRRGSTVSVSAVVVAGEGDSMQRDYEYDSRRFLADLDCPAAIGAEAARRTLARLNPGRAPTGPMPVIFDPRVGASLLGHLVGAVSGGAITRGTSFLLDREGQAILPEALSVVDDPHRARGPRSRAFDGEGLPTRRAAIIDRGVLTTFLLNSADARQLGRAPTGHAARGAGGPPGTGVTNLHLEGGSGAAADLMAGVTLGIYVTELIGMGVNGLTGDYSRGAAGFLIRDGQLAEPVAELTVAGNLLDMFRNLRAADDLRLRHATNAPTLRIDGMTVAGS